MDASLLDSEDPETQALLGKLLLESGMDPSQLGMGVGDAGTDQKSFGGIPYKKVSPSPGFCVKLKGTNNEKVFINVCHSDMVIPTKDITDDELIKILDSDDMSQFRISMCIGEPHAEIDKSGGGCTAYDVIVHTDFIRKVQSSDIFQKFFLSVVCEGIEEKYKTELKRDWVVLKNRRSVGKLQEQNVRVRSKPLIMDLDNGMGQGNERDTQTRSGLIQEVQNSEKQEPDMKKAPEPKFSIIREPAEGYPEFLVAEIHLPRVKTAQTLALDVGEDRILLETRSNVYHLDVFLPYNLVQEEVGAQFDRNTKILTLTMPVQAES